MYTRYTATSLIETKVLLLTTGPIHHANIAVNAFVESILVCQRYCVINSSEFSLSNVSEAVWSMPTSGPGERTD